MDARIPLSSHNIKRYINLCKIYRIKKKKNEERWKKKNDTKTIKLFDVCLTVYICCEGVGSWMSCPYKRVLWKHLYLKNHWRCNIIILKYHFSNPFTSRCIQYWKTTLNSNWIMQSLFLFLCKIYKCFFSFFFTKYIKYIIQTLYGKFSDKLWYIIGTWIWAILMCMLKCILRIKL